MPLARTSRGREADESRLRLFSETVNHRRLYVALFRLSLFQWSTATAPSGFNTSSGKNSAIATCVQYLRRSPDGSVALNVL